MFVPKVSIIVSCFKTDRYLEKFFYNFLSQSFFNQTEIIMHFNNPSNYEMNLANYYKKRFPDHFIILNTDNIVSYSKSWNICIENSKSQIIAIWNIDDLRTKNSIEIQYEYLLDNKDYDLVYGNYIVVDEYNKKTGIFVSHKNTDKSELYKSFIFGPFFMFTKKIIYTIGFFDEQLKSGADYDFALRFSKNFQSLHINHLIGFYTDEKKGLSTGSFLQPIERTLIEIRYGLYEKIDFRFFFQVFIKKYKIKLLKKDDLWTYNDFYVRINKIKIVFYFIKYLINFNNYLYFAKKILKKINS